MYLVLAIYGGVPDLDNTRLFKDIHADQALQHAKRLVIEKELKLPEDDSKFYNGVGDDIGEIHIQILEVEAE